MTSTNNVSKIKQLDKLCVVHADFDIWSGQTKLAVEDLKLGDGGEIPPAALAQLGSKRICNPERLKGFHKLKTRAIRKLEHYGLRFMNGWAVPTNRLDEILMHLDDIAAEFAKERQDFLDQYDATVESWCRDNPDYESIIRRGAMPRDVVEQRVGFDYQVYMVQPAGSPTDQVQARLNRKVGGLSDDLFDEIVSASNDFYTSKLQGQIEVKKGTRSHLKKIRDKVDGLSFLNGAFAPLVKLLDQTLTGYETQAQGHRIVAPFLYQVVAVVLIMCDRSRIQDYASGNVTVDSMMPAIGQADTVPQPTTFDFGAVATSAQLSNDQDTDDQIDQTATAPEPTAAQPSQLVPEPQMDTAGDIKTGDDLLADMDAFFKSCTDNSPSDEDEPQVQPQVQIAPTSAPATPSTTAPAVRDTAASYVAPASDFASVGEDDWGSW